MPPFKSMAPGWSCELHFDHPGRLPDNHLSEAYQACASLIRFQGEVGYSPTTQRFVTRDQGALTLAREFSQLAPPVSGTHPKLVGLGVTRGFITRDLACLSRSPVDSGRLSETVPSSYSP